MVQTPKSSDPHSRGATAVENGISVSTSPAETEIQDKPDVIEVLLVLARGKKPILLFTLAVLLVATIVVLVLPKTYTATTTILPPQQKQSAVNSMIGQIGIIAGLGGSDLGLKNPDDLFVAMLTSRTVEDNLINRFDLRQDYRVSRYEDARKKLAELLKAQGIERGWP